MNFYTSFQAESWEARAQQCIQAKPNWSLSEVETLVKAGEAIAGGLPSLQTLRDSVKKAKDWKQRVGLLYGKKSETMPYLETMETLVHRSRFIQVNLGQQLTEIEEQVSLARTWRQRAYRVFVKKQSPLSLLDVVTPRVDYNAEGVKKKRRSQHPAPSGGGASGADDVPGIIQHPSFSHLTAKDLSEPQSFVTAYSEAEKEQLEGMRRLRENNSSSNVGSAASSDGKKDGGSKGQAKITCEMCREPFHPAYVPLPEFGSPEQAIEDLANGDGSNSGGEEKSEADKEKKKDRRMPKDLREIKFLCPSCMRSRRPRIETILSLLVALQKVQVRMPEGDALQCLTESAMSWKNRASAALSAGEVAAAAKKLNRGGSDGDWSSATVDLSESSVKKLEELMLEGDLMEMHMEETELIWRLLLASEPRRSRALPDLKELQADLEAVRAEKLKARRKRKATTDSDGGASDGGSSAATPASKRGKKDGGEGSAPKTKVTTKRGGKRASSSSSSSASAAAASSGSSDDKGKLEEDEQEECSALPTCLRPNGKVS